MCIWNTKNFFFFSSGSLEKHFLKKCVTGEQKEVNSANFSVSLIILLQDVRIYSSETLLYYPRQYFLYAQ